MDEMSVTDGMLNAEPRHASHCPTWGQYVGWIRARALCIQILMLLLACSLLLASIFSLFHQSATQLEGFSQYHGSIADVLKMLPSELRINFIRQIAPKEFQDASVPLNETDHDLMDLIAVSYLVDGLNASVDPCEDFYEFACGNEAYGKIKQDHFRDTRYFMIGRIKEIMENWNATSSHSRPMNLAVEFYNQCRYETAFDDGMESVYKIMNSIGGWPSSDSNWSEEKFEFLKMTAKSRRLYGRNSFFSVAVFLHPQNRTRNVIYLHTPDFSIPEEVLGACVVNETIVDAYQAQYAHAVSAVRGPDDAGCEFDASETYNLERRLARAVTRDSDDEPLEVTTLETFQLQMDKVKVSASHAKIDWTHMLNEIFQTSGTTVTPDQEIVVGDMKFMRKLVEILDTFPLRTLANYLQWTLMREWLPLLSSSNISAIHANFSAILGIVYDDDATGAGSNGTCLTETMNMFAMPLCQEFLRRSIFTPYDRYAVHNMTTALRESFMEIISENSWISGSARIKAVEKIEGMTQFVGYPDWITNETRMDEEYRQLQFGNDQVDNMVNLLQWTSDRNFNTLNWDGTDLWMVPGTFGVQNSRSIGTSMLSIRKHILAMESAASISIHYISPLDANAYHRWAYNSILIPMGIAFPPFYFSSGPAYVNLGKLGRAIGHEIAHVFDSNGIKYDAQGNENEWLSPEDREKFEQSANCFVEQYEHYTVLPGKTINGSVTLNENIADNLGLDLAYRAYKRTVQQGQVKQPKKLLGLEKLSPQQLFFLSFARSKCEAIPPWVLERILLYDNHSPNKYRVIGSIQNSKGFAKAYQCPVGKPMNPKTKCSLW